jgi:hypothetical protein
MYVKPTKLLLYGEYLFLISIILQLNNNKKNKIHKTKEVIRLIKSKKIIFF